MNGNLEVRTRGGHDVAVAVPELGGLIDALDGRSAVLDGELIARQGGRGTSSGSVRALLLASPKPWRVSGPERR